ncbi:MAG TPA: sigma-70 family RNA polymerase sigma factor [Symbiobacteriaceae bacterium]|nr:sigma-70 family RNA polymerase sigma factor [Symbiobacteriaceae bacterium]
MENLVDLVTQYQGPLFAYLYRMCGDAGHAEELMQETFVRALRAADRYRPEASVKTWLLSIATNLLRDQWRRRKRWGPMLPFSDWGGGATDSMDDEVLLHIEHEQVRAGLLQLPLEQRSVILLRYYEELSYEEIARTLSVPIGTVRSRIHNGLQRLKRMLATEVMVR